MLLPSICKKDRAESGFPTVPISEMMSVGDRNPCWSQMNSAMACGLALIVTLSILSWFNIKEIAGFLIVSEAVIQADMAVVLSGGGVVRVLAARDFYKNGSIKKILLIPEPTGGTPVDKELIQLGIKVEKTNELIKRILKASQIPISDVLTLSHSINGTINEAEGVKEFLKKYPHPIERIVIVTSKISSQRQCYIFRQVLINEEVFCSTSHYDTFDIDNWWHHPRLVLSVFNEYLKFTANFFTLLIQ